MLKSSFKRFSSHLSPASETHRLPLGHIPPSMLLSADPPLLVRQRKRHVLPAVLMRSGTSKGLFLHRAHLPASQDAWTPWILAAMGSKNSDPRQIDGVGGATSTTSKVAIVAPSERPGIDVEYTFAQVAVGRDRVDYSGNCGNIASGIGPFALEEGLVRPKPGQRQINIRIFNTNTSRTLVETVEINEEGGFEEEGDYQIAGVKGSGSEIKVAFMNPAGSMTGKLFPTGNREDSIVVDSPRGGLGPFSVQASLVDAANPFIFVDASTMPLLANALEPGSQQFLAIIEGIRRAGAVLFGLASSPEAAADVRGTPKIALVSRPTIFLGDRCWGNRIPDIHVKSFSMGNPHPSLQLTGAVCLGAAVCIEGTVPYRIAASQPTFMPTPERTPSPPGLEECTASRYVEKLVEKEVSIAHSSGSIQVDAKVKATHDRADVESCSVSRTARRLFEGNVLFHL